jgi:opacity protein-like surface antigen
MHRASLFILVCILSSQVRATDLTLLFGYQANGDFELSDSFDQSPNGQDLGEPGDDLSLDGGAAVSVAVDFVFNNDPNARIGFFVTRHEGEFDSNAGLDDVEMEVTHIHFTAMNYYPSGNWEPFVLAGIGAGIFSPEDSSLSDDTLFSAQIGGGANYKISENLLLRFDARWIPTFFNGSASGICSGGCTIALKSDVYNQFQANVGLQFRF